MLHYLYIVFTSLSADDNLVGGSLCTVEIIVVSLNTSPELPRTRDLKTVVINFKLTLLANCTYKLLLVVNVKILFPLRLFYCMLPPNVIPHITEAVLYETTSLFVQNDKEINGKMFTPLGELIKNINKEKSNSDYVKWLEEGNFHDTDFKFPHESVKITLQDESIKNKVRVIMVNFTRCSIPKSRDLVNNIYLDVENNKDLKGKKSVYMITNVLMAKTIEFRVTRGTSSRIFHLGNASPLVFGLEEFLIGDDGKLISKEPVAIVSKSLNWKKVDPSDHLYNPDKEAASCDA